ncbi:hypothetical protein Air01nite_72480 [Asanoa iriomotensis]|uniref:Uncharacterized protein n=1 Tax=Asanoa iriomotensis TaxID=234613 RepID=A0ABQ4CEG4_9ACTN|nr:hypothetical protein Air01nite_72480 [Asanoa iriomotensis]
MTLTRSNTRPSKAAFAATNSGSAFQPEWSNAQPSQAAYTWKSCRSPAKRIAVTLIGRSGKVSRQAQARMWHAPAAKKAWSALSHAMR